MDLRRSALGYKECVGCSTEVKWSGVPVINHKTGNEVQIIKDPDAAAEFIAKSSRVGFGTLKGMTASYKKVVEVKASNTLLPDKPLLNKVVNKRSLPHDYEKVGEEMLSCLEKEGKEAALLHIEKAREEKRIFGKHFEQLQSMLDALCSS
jgi:hypothetical protein